MILLPIFCCAQVNESFLDGNFINNPIWSGTTSNFTVNNSLQLQSKATATSVSWLFTPSEAISNASWECWVKIAYTTSASNFSSIYIISDRNDLTAGCNGYYVQVGGTNDEVSLFVQEGTKKTKIIDGVDKRTDGNSVEMRIKVTRDADGNFSLYSKLPTETDFVLEGTTQNNIFTSSAYFGLLYSNTSTTGSAYYFDDIVVTGQKQADTTIPLWKVFRLEQPNLLKLGFSEAMDFSRCTFSVNGDIGVPSSQVISDDKCSVILSFSKEFQRGRFYTLHIDGLTDVAGNALQETQRDIGIIEPTAVGDLSFNEIMFDNPQNSLEYVEIYNNSDKLLDLSGMIFTTRKADGSLNSGNKIPALTYLFPDQYVAFCEFPDSIKNYHNCPVGSYIVKTEWSSLNNETATVVLTNVDKDTVFDEFKYDVKWHNVMVKNPKGVALERINPQLPVQDVASWHSAASEVKYGTPGYKNSQYRDLSAINESKNFVWAEPTAFSPDNDGVDDICLFRYRTDSNGFIANAYILTPNGEKLLQLLSNQLLSTEGIFSWDGHTSKGKNTNAGVYVLYFEMFNTTTGERKHTKIPIVVTSR